ncbi:MAG: hypothetical protein ABS69_02450 [Nitrosomonadales bacterium SCN 54-20]|nr:MAG: hypothetical protein ABS69_02450 [Nitrosomonadales bacterium SCN 54-20]
MPDNNAYTTFVLAIAQKSAARWEILIFHLKHPSLGPQFFMWTGLFSLVNQSKDQAQRSLNP